MAKIGRATAWMTMAVVSLSATLIGGIALGIYLCGSTGRTMAPAILSGNYCARADNGTLAGLFVLPDDGSRGKWPDGKMMKLADGKLELRPFAPDAPDVVQVDEQFLNEPLNDADSGKMFAMLRGPGGKYHIMAPTEFGDSPHIMRYFYIIRPDGSFTKVEPELAGNATGQLQLYLSEDRVMATQEYELGHYMLYDLHGSTARAGTYAGQPFVPEPLK